MGEEQKAGAVRAGVRRVRECLKDVIENIKDLDKIEELHGSLVVDVNVGKIKAVVEAVIKPYDARITYLLRRAFDLKNGDQEDE